MWAHPEEPQDRVSDTEEAWGIERNELIDIVKTKQKEPKCTCKSILVFLYEVKITILYSYSCVILLEPQRIFFLWDFWRKRSPSTWSLLSGCTKLLIAINNGCVHRRLPWRRQWLKQWAPRLHWTLHSELQDGDCCWSTVSAYMEWLHG